MYRRENWPSLFKDPDQLEDYPPDQDKSELKWHKILWAIQDLDLEWLMLQKRKRELKDRCQKCFDESRRPHDKMRQSLYKQIFQSSMKFLESANSEREVEDVETKFMFHFNQDVLPLELHNVAEEDIWKQVWEACQYNMKSVYSVCSKAGLWRVAYNFGPSSEELGLQLSGEMNINELEEPEEMPLEIAARFTSDIFRTPEHVLKGARLLAAVEISLEPIIRQYMRRKYFDALVLRTRLSRKTKWPKVGKRLSKIKDEELFRIQKAKDNGTLDFTIKLLDDDVEDLLMDLKRLYLHINDANISVGPWHEEREKILENAFFRYLLPSMMHEARSLCRNRVRSWLRFEYGEALWKRVSVIPNRWKQSHSSEDHVVPKVIACCLGPGITDTTFVAIDSSGDMLNKLCIHGLTNLSHDSVVLKQQDRDDVLKFMTSYKPDVVVLPPSSILQDEIPKITSQMAHHIDVVFSGDEPFGRLQSDVVKHTLTIGRYHQNPLALVATLCGPGREILKWNLCRSENFLTPDEGYAMIVQVMVDVTNQVGLDINLAGSHEWLFAPLQFISGLGPKKAECLRRSVVQSGAIHTREELMTRHGLGQTVYANAAGFLRVQKSGLAGSSTRAFNPLDDTRIHPESYGFAQVFAKDVYKVESGSDHEDPMQMAIKLIRDQPSILKSLDIESYAKTKKLENEVKRICFIRRELLQGFEDWREQCEPSQYAQEGKTNMFSLVVDYSLPSGVVPFIRQLYILLCTNQKSVSDALQWSTDGTRFGVVSDKCLEEIFPLHFPGTDYIRFYKQLVLYGFVADGRWWKHEENLFIKCFPELLVHIKPKSMSNLFTNSHLKIALQPTKKRGG